MSGRKRRAGKPPCETERPAGAPSRTDPVYISKKMSYCLRHNPGKYGLVPDGEGYVPLDRFLAAMNRVHHFDPPLTEKRIRDVMAHSDKRRFEIAEGRIRALYGHSLPKKIEKAPVQPPAVLYHGTARRFLPSIREMGLLPMKRQYVHLSVDIETAEQVGRRKDPRPVVLAVDAGRAAADGVCFYAGNEKTFLADRIPPEYLSGGDGRTARQERTGGSV